MNDLIEALQIMAKYMKDGFNTKYPTGCEHDTLYVHGLYIELITEEDKERLEELGFTISDEVDGAMESHRFGSC